MTLRLADIDCEGALREALEAATGESRAEFLGRLAVGGGALLAALAWSPEAPAASRRDVAVLNFALTLEYLQAAFYTEAERLGALRDNLRPIPRQLGAVERAHVQAIRKVLGRQAVGRATFDFRGVTEDSDAFLRTAVAFEDLAVAAYKGQAGRIQSPALLAAAISIHTVEARHAAWMRYLVGVKPAARAFDRARSGESVRRTVASTRFIVGAAKTSARRRRPRFTG
jgi:Ferritin-like domain